MDELTKKLFDVIEEEKPETVLELIKKKIRRFFWGHDDKLETISELIKAGADVNEQNKHGTTALMYAARYQPKVLAELIKTGAVV